MLQCDGEESTYVQLLREWAASLSDTALAACAVRIGADADETKDAKTLANYSAADRLLTFLAASPHLVWFQSKLPKDMTLAKKFDESRSPEHNGRRIWHEIFGYKTLPPSTLWDMMELLLYGSPKLRSVLRSWASNINNDPGRKLMIT